MFFFTEGALSPMSDPNQILSTKRLFAGRFKNGVVILLTGLLLLVCFQTLISPRIGFVGYSRNSFYIQDFAYHVILADHFWFTEKGNVYDLDFQLRALSAHMNRPALVAMPVGVTPLAFVVWWPFAYIAGQNLSFAYSLWMTISFLILMTALWRIWTYLSPLKSFQTLPLVLCGVTCFSLVGVTTVIVGQTSIFIAGILSFLFYRVFRYGNDPEKAAIDWPIVILVLTAGMKPPYLVIGFGMLLIYGLWWEAVVSAVLAVLLLIILTPMMSTNWIGAYWQMVQMYGSGNFPDIYAWSIAPPTMNNFRSALSGFATDRTAAVGSSVVSSLFFLGIVVMSLFQGRQVPAWRPKLITGLIAVCLLFAPYCGAYEDILLVPVFAVVMVTGKSWPVQSRQGMVVTLALFLCLLHIVPGLHYHGVFWLLKGFVLAGMIRAAGKMPAIDAAADVQETLRTH